MTRPRTTRLSAVLVAVALAVLGIRAALPSGTYFEVTKHLEILTSVFRGVHEFYVEEPEPGTLMRVAIDAMLDDPSVIRHHRKLLSVRENAAFIRAPKILDHGKATPIAWVGEELVAIQHENIIGASYHPELTNSTMLHRKLIELIKAN